MIPSSSTRRKRTKLDLKLFRERGQLARIPQLQARTLCIQEQNTGKIFIWKNGIVAPEGLVVKLQAALDAQQWWFRLP